MDLANLLDLLTGASELTPNQMHFAAIVVIVLWLLRNSFKLWRLERLPSNRDFLSRRRKK